MFEHYAKACKQTTVNPIYIWVNRGRTIVSTIDTQVRQRWAQAFDNQMYPVDGKQ